MKDWHSEDEIKAQLRELTRETRKLRSGLDALLRPSRTLAPREKTLAPRATVDDQPAKPEPPPAGSPRRRPGKQK